MRELRRRARGWRLEDARAALSRGAWKEARTGFEAICARGETAEALEGLGWAAWSGPPPEISPPLACPSAAEPRRSRARRPTGQEASRSATSASSRLTRGACIAGGTSTFRLTRHWRSRRVNTLPHGPLMAALRRVGYAPVDDGTAMRSWCLGDLVVLGISASGASLELASPAAGEYP